MDIPSQLQAAEQALQQGRWELAEQAYRSILQVEPNHIETLNNLATLRKNTGQLASAIAGFELAISLRPDLAVLQYNLANALKIAKRSAEAIEAYQRSLALDPRWLPAYQNLGDTYRELGRREEAIACYRQALALQPDLHAVHNNLGQTLLGLGDFQQAEFHFRQAIALCPSLPELYNNLGATLQAEGRPAEAMACLQQAIALRPDYFEALLNLGTGLAADYQHEPAIEALQRAVARRPDHQPALAILIHQLQSIGRWHEAACLAARLLPMLELEDGLAEGRETADLVRPLDLLSLPVVTTAAQQYRCAVRWSQARYPAQPALHGRPPEAGRLRDGRPVRIGYLSADFNEHPVGYLTAELFEKHRRPAWEVFGYSIGSDHASPLSQRIQRGFDHYRPLQTLTFRQAAQQIADDGIDILVDLQGHTRQQRTEILAYRPAPLQVNYLGFAGTMGAPFIDYILVDKFAVPASQQPYFTEHLVHLPGCFMVYDSRREIDPNPVTRQHSGLPEGAFVLCAFNSPVKVTASMLEVWLSILQAIPRAVLWLREWHPASRVPWQQAAAAHGIDPSRLVFAPKVSMPRHLARHTLADLFLDTFPYNQHSTAADALRMGLPVLTLCGSTFASRVAGSLLNCLGLESLITTTPEAYRQRAIELAEQPTRLSQIQGQLQYQLSHHALFRAEPLVAAIEAAFRRMFTRYHQGLGPSSWSVEDIADG
jgi:protein O-GlcNAc transferase